VKSQPSPDAAEPRLELVPARAFLFTCEPRFTWLGGPYGDVVTTLRSAVLDGAGALVLTGEPGTGKTVIANTLAALLRPNGVTIGRIDFPSRDRREFLEAVGKAYGWPDVRGEAFVPIAERFLSETLARETRALLILEEAQGLGADVLAEVASLAQLSKRVGGDHGSPLSILLVGQDELLEVLRSPEHAALETTIAGRHRLRRLTEDEVRGYIEHRLDITESPRDRFTPSAIGRIAELSHGIPRVINTLCERALTEASRLAATTVDAKLVDVAAEEQVAPGSADFPASISPTTVEPSAAPAPLRRPGRGAAVVVILVAALALAAAYTVQRLAHQPVAAKPTPLAPSAQTPTDAPAPRDAPSAPDSTSAEPVTGAIPTTPGEAPSPEASGAERGPTPEIASPSISLPAREIAPPRAPDASPLPRSPSPPARQAPDRRESGTAGRDAPDSGGIIDWLLRESPRQ
jgi:general secretion pathway protein A